MSLNAATLQEDVTRIVQDVFVTMLSMEAEVAGEPAPAGAAPLVTAAMHLSGSWNGAVLMQCDLPAACQFAAAMLGIDPPAGADETVKDVMGELINMVAGNFKAVLQGGATLSLPTLVSGSDYRVRFLRGVQTARVSFRTPAGTVVVSIVEIQPV